MPSLTTHLVDPESGNAVTETHQGPFPHLGTHAYCGAEVERRKTDTPLGWEAVNYTAAGLIDKHDDVCPECVLGFEEKHGRLPRGIEPRA